MSPLQTTLQRIVFNKAQRHLLSDIFAGIAKTLMPSVIISQFTIPFPSAINQLLFTISASFICVLCIIISLILEESQHVSLHRN